METGGELLVIAPGVHKFGEDDKIDVLIRKYGYRKTPEVFCIPNLCTDQQDLTHL